MLSGKTGAAAHGGRDDGAPLGLLAARASQRNGSERLERSTTLLPVLREVLASEEFPTVRDKEHAFLARTGKSRATFYRLRGLLSGLHS
jgi:hypothetical protein